MQNKIIGVGILGLLVVLLAYVVITTGPDVEPERQPREELETDVAEIARLERVDLELGNNLLSQYGEEDPITVARELSDEDGMSEAMSYLAALKQQYGPQTHTGVRVQLADMLIRMDEMELAERELKEVIGLVSYDEWAMRLLARIYESRGDIGESIDILEESINLPQADAFGKARAYAEKSEIYINEGEITKAMEALENAIELTPEEEEKERFREMMEDLKGIE